MLEKGRCWWVMVGDGRWGCAAVMVSFRVFLLSFTPKRYRQHRFGCFVAFQGLQPVGPNNDCLYRPSNIFARTSMDLGFDGGKSWKPADFCAIQDRCRFKQSQPFLIINTFTNLRRLAKETPTHTHTHVFSFSLRVSVNSTTMND